MSRLTVKQAEQMGLISSSEAATLRPGTVAKGRRTKLAGQMNGMERRYSEVLEVRKARGEILWWRFEGLTFKLADDTRYQADFAVMLADETLEIHETKGHMEDDAWVKLKVAAGQFPFRFVLVREVKKQFTFKVVGE